MPGGPGFISERKVLTEMLELYKESPCLWDPNHDMFGSKGAKDQAITAMLDKYKILVQDANADTLKKKLEIMKTSYRREYKKALQNKQHTPSLWYYNLLTFLNEGTAATTTCQSEEDDEDSPLVKNEAYYNQTKRIRPSSVFLSEQSDPEEFTYNFKPEEIAETDAFGRSLGLQLSELSAMQKTIAEKLISDIVYYARLDKLTTKTSLINLNDDYIL